MKKAVIFAAAAMIGSMTLLAAPSQTQAASLQGKNVVIKKVVKGDENCLKDYLDTSKWENGIRIELPCLPVVPGQPDNKPEKPDNKPEQPGNPDNKPETPDNKPETPDNKPERPGTPDNKPETPEIPGNPDNKPETPDNKPSIPDTEQPGDSNQSEHPYVLRVVELVNAERSKAGLKPLTLQKNVTKAAQVRAVEIEKSFSHTRPNGTGFATALKEAGVTYRGSGENIAWGQKTPEQVMEGWMNSPGHRANILNAHYTTIGVGYHQNTLGTNYWSQLFTY